MHELRVTVDIVIFTVRNSELQVLLCAKRGVPPFEGLDLQFREASYGRTNRSMTRPSVSCTRKRGFVTIFLEQLYSFGEPKRDPRGRVITVAYFALIASDKVLLVAGADAAKTGCSFRLVEYCRSHSIINLFFTTPSRDYATNWNIRPSDFNCSRKFTLRELQGVYEAILGRALDKRNFRPQDCAWKILTPCF